MKHSKKLLCFAWMTVPLMAGSLLAAPLDPSINYQGRLDQGGQPATGAFLMRFTLWDALTAGNFLASAPTNTVPVTNGLFNVELAFSGTNVFGDDRWLQLEVWPNNAFQPTLLSPRVRLAPTANAIYAVSAGSVATGAVSTAQLAANAVTTAQLAPNSVTAPNIANGQVVRSFNNLRDAVELTAGPNVAIGTNGNVLTISATGPGGGTGWSLTGNVSASGNFLGTLNNLPLDVRVNNARTLRLEPNANGPNVIGGLSGNQADVGAIGVTIAGGGAGPGFVGYSASNRVTEHFGTISGGAYNLVGNTNGNFSDAFFATIGGGFHNTASGIIATIAGGSDNRAGANDTFVGGGYMNMAQLNRDIVVGGALNVARGGSSIVRGGENNAASGGFSIIAGGEYNAASGAHAAVGGGQFNSAEGPNSTIAGGWANRATGAVSVVGGGDSHEAFGDNSTIAGGTANHTEGFASTVGGGRLNRATGYSVVGGGLANYESDTIQITGGGEFPPMTNVYPLVYATIGGGRNNTNLAAGSSIGGGASNFVNFSGQNLRILSDRRGPAEQRV